MSSSATRRSTRVLAGAAAAVAAAVVPATLIGLSGTAFAAYPPSNPECSSATGAHTPGSSVTLTGIGFTPGQTVTVGGLGGAVVITRTVKADANGAVKVLERLGNGRAQFTLSGTKLDAHCGLISVEGVTASKPATPTVAPSTAVSAVPTPAGPTVAATTATRTLPYTGASHVRDAAAIGGGLLCLGVGLVAVGSIRKPQGAHR